MPSIRSQLAALALAGLPGGSAPAYEATGLELTPEEQHAFAAMRALWSSLDRRTGLIPLRDGILTLYVPDDFYFIDAEDTERVLVEAWGNPPGQDTLGMLFPAGVTPFDEDAWAVTLEYDEDGHVSDADAAHIDYWKLLSEMRADIHTANPHRIDAGYPPIELVGWVEPPHYDACTRKLYWAKELRFGDAANNSLSYEVLALGRTGVLSMTFIADTTQLAAINARRDRVLAMVEFSPGKRYDDFDASTDEVALYGIGTLIAGEVVSKSSVVASALAMLKKLGASIVEALVAVAHQTKRILAGSAR